MIPRDGETVYAHTSTLRKVRDPFLGNRWQPVCVSCGPVAKPTTDKESAEAMRHGHERSGK